MDTQLGNKKDLPEYFAGRFVGDNVDCGDSQIGVAEHYDDGSFRLRSHGDLQVLAKDVGKRVIQMVFVFGDLVFKWSCSTHYYGVVLKWVPYVCVSCGVSRKMYEFDPPEVHTERMFLRITFNCKGFSYDGDCHTSSTSFMDNLDVLCMDVHIIINKPWSGEMGESYKLSPWDAKIKLWWKLVGSFGMLEQVAEGMRHWIDKGCVYSLALVKPRLGDGTRGRTMSCRVKRPISYTETEEGMVFHIGVIDNMVGGAESYDRLFATALHDNWKIREARGPPCPSKLTGVCYLRNCSDLGECFADVHVVSATASPANQPDEVNSEVDRLAAILSESAISSVPLNSGIGMNVGADLPRRDRNGRAGKARRRRARKN